MDKDVQKLIKLFAENDVADIEADIAPFIMKYFKTDWAITKEDFYSKNYDLVKKFKKNLEEIDADPQVPNEKERVKSCLELCWKKANFNTLDTEVFKYQMDVFTELVSNYYEKKWSKSQLDHFKNVSVIFRDYNNYFISYTNHFAKTINVNYDFVYKSLFKTEDYSTDDYNKKNLLAKAFNTYFGLRNLRKGFFDRDSMRVSDLISEKVKHNVDKSIALVQLLSKASFQYTEPNWSFDEYQEYKDSRERFSKAENGTKVAFAPLPFFVLIEKDPFPINNDLAPEEYGEWIKLVKAELHCDLSDKTEFKGFTDDIEKLINSIVIYKSNMISNVPD